MAVDLAAWYEKYGPMVIRRCRSLLRNDEEAMDAVQDVFLNLLRQESRIRDSFPSSLLYTIATNVCLNKFRAKRREVPDTWVSGAGLSGEWDAVSVSDGAYEQVDAELLVKAILEDESEENRAICFMYHADGMTLKEIGEAVGLSISGVKKRLEAFRKRARVKLGEDV